MYLSVDKSENVGRCGTCRRTWKWTAKLFFHFLDLFVLNAFILRSCCEPPNISLTCSEYCHGHYQGTERKIKFICHHPLPSGSTKNQSLAWERKQRKFIVCSLKEKLSTSSYLCRVVWLHSEFLRVFGRIKRKQIFRWVWKSTEL
jgi:hypothetical protein